MDEGEIDPYKMLELDSTLEEVADSDVLKVSLHAKNGEHAIQAGLSLKAAPPRVLNTPGSRLFNTKAYCY